MLQGLGVVMLLIGLTAKVPQIRALWRSQSAVGLSLLSLELETAGLCIVTACTHQLLLWLVRAPQCLTLHPLEPADGYIMKLSLLAYIEFIPILLQQLALLYLSYDLAEVRSWRLAIVTTVLSGFALNIYLGDCPMVCDSSGPVRWRWPAAQIQRLCVHAGNVSQDMIQVAYSFQLFNLLAARLPQIWTNFRVGPWNS